MSWFLCAVDKFCGNAELSDCYTLPYLAVCSGLQTTPVAALALGSDWNQELGGASAKAFVLSISPWPPALSCELSRMWDGGGGGNPGPSAVLNKQAMQMVNGREGWLLLHLVSVFWELGKLGKGERAGVELLKTSRYPVSPLIAHTTPS